MKSIYLILAATFVASACTQDLRSPSEPQLQTRVAIQNVVVREDIRHELIEEERHLLEKLLITATRKDLTEAMRAHNDSAIALARRSIALFEQDSAGIDIRRSARALSRLARPHAAWAGQNHGPGDFDPNFTRTTLEILSGFFPRFIMQNVLTLPPIYNSMRSTGSYTKLGVFHELWNVKEQGMLEGDILQHISLEPDFPGPEEIPLGLFATQDLLVDCSHVGMEANMTTAHLAGFFPEFTGWLQKTAVTSATDDGMCPHVAPVAHFKMISGDSAARDNATLVVRVASGTPTISLSADLTERDAPIVSYEWTTTNSSGASHPTSGFNSSFSTRLQTGVSLKVTDALGKTSTASGSVVVVVDCSDSSATNRGQPGPCKYSSNPPSAGGGGPLPPPPTIPTPPPTGEVCHVYEMQEQHLLEGYIIVTSDPWIECDTYGSASATSIVSLGVSVSASSATGSCTPWGTSNPAVATMSPSGVVTSAGTGATYRVEKCGDRLRATLVYVRNPSDLSNATNAGCSDGHTYDVIRAAANGTWWDTGNSCLGGGVPVQSQVSVTAPPSSLVAMNLSQVAIRPQFSPPTNSCNSSTPNLCFVSIGIADNDQQYVDVRHPQVGGFIVDMAGGATQAAWPMTVTYRYNGQVVSTATASSRSTFPGAPSVTMAGLNDGDLVVASIEVTDHTGVRMTQAATIPVQFPPDPGDLKAPRAKGTAAPSRGDKMRALREYIKHTHRLPTDAEYLRFLGYVP